MNFKTTLKELETISKELVSSFDRKGGVPVPTKFNEPDEISTAFTHHVVNLKKTETQKDTQKAMHKLISGFSDKTESERAGISAKYLSRSIHPLATDGIETPTTRAFAWSDIDGKDRISATAKFPALEKRGLFSLFGKKAPENPIEAMKSADTHYHELAHLYHSVGKREFHDAPSIEAYAMGFSTAKLLADGHTAEDLRKTINTYNHEKPEKFLSYYLNVNPGEIPKRKDVSEIKNYGFGYKTEDHIIRRWENGERWGSDDKEIGKVASHSTRQTAPDLMSDQRLAENHYEKATDELTNKSIIEAYSRKKAYFYPQLRSKRGAESFMSITPMPEHLLPEGSTDPEKNPALKTEMESWKKTLENNYKNREKMDIQAAVSTRLKIDPYNHPNAETPKSDHLHHQMAQISKNLRAEIFKSPAKTKQGMEM